MTRPRRSHLFMPGSNPRALEKARNLAADGLILDLEDSVAPDAKAAARDGIAAAIAAKGFGKREILIRTNGLDTPWWADDVAMAAKASPDGILVPKVSSVEDLDAIGRRLAELGAAPTVKVWAMIETARAVLHAEELAAAGRNPTSRLSGFVFGPNDISRETRIKMLPGRAAMIPMITHCILATRAHGLEILDGPYSDINNSDGFATECAQGRDLGFDGKTLIHPLADRSLQRDLHAAGRGSRARAKNHRGVRIARERLARRDPPRRGDGRAAACRHGAAHDRDCGRDRGDGEGLRCVPGPFRLSGSRRYAGRFAAGHCSKLLGSIACARA
ncbi:citrate lyase beta subunit [Bradyrhizobium diazoefficiens]